MKTRKITIYIIILVSLFCAKLNAQVYDDFKHTGNILSEVRQTYHYKNSLPNSYNYDKTTALSIVFKKDTILFKYPAIRVLFPFFPTTYRYYPKKRIITIKDASDKEVTIINFNKQFESEVIAEYLTNFNYDQDTVKSDAIKYSIIVSSDSIIKQHFLGKYDVYRIKLQFSDIEEVKDWFYTYDPIKEKEVLDFYEEPKKKKVVFYIDWVEGVGIVEVHRMYDNKVFNTASLKTMEKPAKWSSSPINVDSLPDSLLNVYLYPVEIVEASNFGILQPMYQHIRIHHYLETKGSYTLNLIQGFLFEKDSAQYSFFSAYNPKLSFLDYSIFKFKGKSLYLRKKNSIGAPRPYLIGSDSIFVIKAPKFGMSDQYYKPQATYESLGWKKNGWKDKYDLLTVKVSDYGTSTLKKYDEESKSFKPAFENPDPKKYFFYLKWVKEIGLVGIEEYYDGKLFRNFELTHITDRYVGYIPKTPIEELTEKQLMIMKYKPEEE